MPREDFIEVSGSIIELLPGGVCRVALPNGHRIVAHASRQLRQEAADMAVGDCVTVEMSPYDMSRGRMLKRINNT